MGTGYIKWGIRGALSALAGTLFKMGLAVERLNNDQPAPARENDADEQSKTLDITKTYPPSIFDSELGDKAARVQFRNTVKGLEDATTLITDLENQGLNISHMSASIKAVISPLRDNALSADEKEGLSYKIAALIKSDNLVWHWYDPETRNIYIQGAANENVLAYIENLEQTLQAEPFNLNTGRGTYMPLIYVDIRVLSDHNFDEVQKILDKPWPASSARFEAPDYYKYPRVNDPFQPQSPGEEKIRPPHPPNRYTPFGNAVLGDDYGPGSQNDIFGDGGYTFFGGDGLTNINLPDYGLPLDISQILPPNTNGFHWTGPVNISPDMPIDESYFEGLGWDNPIDWTGLGDDSPDDPDDEGFGTNPGGFDPSRPKPG